MEQRYRDLVHKLDSFLQLFDHGSHLVAMYADVYRRLFNLLEEALLGTRCGAQRRLGVKWFRPRCGG